MESGSETHFEKSVGLIKDDELDGAEVQVHFNDEVE